MTGSLRRDVWNGMIGADMRYRYFDRLAARAKMTDDALHVLLFIASGTTAAGVLGLFTLGATVLAVASAVLAAVTATLYFGQRASKFAEFSVFWGRIHADYKRLRDEMEPGRPSDRVERRNRSLRGCPLPATHGQAGSRPDAWRMAAVGCLRSAGFWKSLLWSD